MKTYTATPDDIRHDWHVVDADGGSPGPPRQRVAQLIRGKHKPTFTPHMDGGDFVIVINASKVKLTGTKVEQKQYFTHTGYMGHESFTPVKRLLAKHPERVIEKAVYGMLPKNSLSQAACSGSSSGCTPAPSTRTPRSSRSPDARTKVNA